MANSLKLNDENYWDSNSIVNYRVTLDNILSMSTKRVTGIGWRRVACIDNKEGTGNKGGAFMVDLHTWYNYRTNMSFTFMINMVHNKVSLTKISSVINALILDKVRVCKDASAKKMYLDVHYNVSVENQVFVNILHFTDTFDRQSYQVVADTPSGEEILATLNIS